MSEDERREALDRLAVELADQGRLIEAGWTILLRTCIPSDAPDAQVREMRLAFMAGSQHLFASIMTILDPGDEEPTVDDMQQSDLIDAELGSRFRRRAASVGWDFVTDLEVLLIDAVKSAIACRELRNVARHADNETRRESWARVIAERPAGQQASASVRWAQNRRSSCFNARQSTTLRDRRESVGRTLRRGELTRSAPRRLRAETVPESSGRLF